MCVLRQPPSEAGRNQELEENEANSEPEVTNSAKPVLKSATHFIGFSPRSQCSCRAEGLLNYLTAVTQDSSSLYESRNESSGESLSVKKTSEG